MSLRTDHLLDEAVRVAVYSHFIEQGGAPDPERLATRCGVMPEARAASYERLAEQRALVLGADGAIWMAIPFSATPTDVQVRGADIRWWANCAFDGLGIPAMLGIDAEVETACPQSGMPILVKVRDQIPTSTACVLHMSVPLAQWWENIGDT